MNDHESIRRLLPLAASGDISADETRHVQEHLTHCDNCRRASRELAAVGDALRALPTPPPRAELVARVRSLAELRMARQCPARRDAAALAPLVMAAWIMALATWPLLRSGARWAFAVWYVPDGGFRTALAAYSILGFLFACVCMLAVAWRARAYGRAK